MSESDDPLTQAELHRGRGPERLDVPRRLIAYARISDLSGKRATSRAAQGIGDQHLACQSISRRVGGVVVHQHSDNDRSASRDEYRPGFESMLIDLHRGHTDGGDPIDGVVVVDEDRIYKTPAQWERFLTAFLASPGRIFADEYGTRDLYQEEAQATGRHGVDVALSENRKRSARTHRWHEAQARRGIAHTGGRTFGYVPVAGEPSAIEVVPEEAAVIRTAVAACIDGQTWAAVTAIFQNSGIPTAKGGLWRQQTVKQIISSPRLAGLRMLNGAVVSDQSGIPVLGRWEPIISQAEWESVRERYTPRERLPGGNTKNPKQKVAIKHLLSGLLRCGREIEGHVCDGRMNGCATKIGISRYRYACRSETGHGCGGTAVSGEWIEREISDLVLVALASLPALIEQPVWERQAELDAVLTRRNDLEMRWQQGNVDDAFFYRNSAVLNEILLDLGEARASWSAVGAVQRDNPEERRSRWDLPQAKGGYDLSEKRAMIFSVLERVYVFPVGRGTKNRGKDSYSVVSNSPPRSQAPD